MEFIIMKSHKHLVTHHQQLMFTPMKLYTGDTDFYSSATIVTNREYEEREQDKTKIKLIDPNFIDQFVEEFEILVKESVIIMSRQGVQYAERLNFEVNDYITNRTIRY